MWITLLNCLSGYTGSSKVRGYRYCLVHMFLAVGLNRSKLAASTGPHTGGKSTPKIRHLTWHFVWDFFGILNTICIYSRATHSQKSATTVCIYTACLTCGICPSPVLSTSQQALFKCHRDVSHLYRLYVDSGAPEVSSLITMSSLVWSSVTKALFHRRLRVS